MVKPKLKRKFPDSTDEKLKLFTAHVITGLTNNSHFPDATEHLAPVELHFKKYVNSIPAPYDRSKSLTTIKLNNKAELIDALQCLTLYVEYRAKFNIEALQSSNFELAGKRQQKGIVGEVRGIEFKTNGEEGLLIVLSKRDTNATIYKARVALEEGAWYKFGANNTRTVKVHNLPAGEKLYVQVRMENSHSKSPWSATMTAEIPKGDTILRKLE